MRLLFIISLSLLLFSCRNNVNEKANKQTETVTNETHQHENETQAIELNHGEKWYIDTNMMTHIRAMEGDALAFSMNPQKDYKSLAEKLQKNIDLLTSNCTMTGKPHDELHKWLLPYIDLVTELSDAKDETESAKHFDNILTSFTTFNNYFQ